MISLRLRILRFPGEQGTGGSLGQVRGSCPKKIPALLVYLVLLPVSLLLAVRLWPMLSADFSPAYALPIGGLSLPVLSRWLGSRGRVFRYLLAVIPVLALASVVLGCLAVSIATPVLAPAYRLVERLMGETPQGKVSSYLELVASGAREEALALWPADERLGPLYEARRQSVTTELEDLEADLSHRVQKTEWWSTCCEPHVITDSRDAGVARLWVEVSRGDEPRQYVFDVFGRGASCWPGMEGCAVRRWQILDVYPSGEEPLVWGWPY